MPNIKRGNRIAFNPIIVIGVIVIGVLMVVVAQLISSEKMISQLKTFVAPIDLSCLNKQNWFPNGTITGRGIDMSAHVAKTKAWARVKSEEPKFSGCAEASGVASTSPSMRCNNQNLLCGNNGEMTLQPLPQTAAYCTFKNTYDPRMRLNTAVYTCTHTCYAFQACKLYTSLLPDGNKFPE